MTNLLHFYDAAGNILVLVIGADDRENEWIGEGTTAYLRVDAVWDRADIRKALAEHQATTKAPKARGLKMINTERASVPMRFVA